jgi:hypothetical protein
MAQGVSSFLKGRKDALSRYLAENETKEVRVSEKTKAFWLEKKSATEDLLMALDEADKDESELSESGRKARVEYFEKTKAAWEVGLATVLNELSKDLVGPFALGAPRHAKWKPHLPLTAPGLSRTGEQISIADMHLAAWLHELVILCGGSVRDDGTAAISRLEEHVGGGFSLPKDVVPAFAPRTTSSNGSEPVPTTTALKPKLAVWWDAFAARSSWQRVFGV